MSNTPKDADNNAILTISRLVQGNTLLLMTDGSPEDTPELPEIHM